MNYPKNKTRLIAFLKENPGLYYKVTLPNGESQTRRLKKAQNNAFSGMRPDGKESWFYYCKSDIYEFIGSLFIVTSSSGNLIFDFGPSEQDINAFNQAAMGGTAA